MRFHHIGIPTTESKEGEVYSPDSKLFLTDIDSHPYRVEWLRFEPGCPMPEIIQRIPHVAFEVDNLQDAIEGQDILIPPKILANGLRIAFIVEGGAPVEFIERPTHQS